MMVEPKNDRKVEHLMTVEPNFDQKAEHSMMAEQMVDHLVVQYFQLPRDSLNRRLIGRLNTR